MIKITNLALKNPVRKKKKSQIFIKFVHWTSRKLKKVLVHKTNA